MGKRSARLLSRIKPKRRWAQFSTGTLLIVVATLSVWLGVAVRQAHRQSAAAAAFKALGGKIEYVDVERDTLAQTYLRRWLPRDYFEEVRTLDLAGTRATDAGLSHLRWLTNLEVLRLSGTRVTDAGLAHLEGLTRLRTLDLCRTRVTDAGLVHLRRLRNLESLYLDDTRVRGSGLAQIGKLTDVQRLSLSGAPVGDAGLEHLHGLTGLRRLWLGSTRVSDAGVLRLQQALPACSFYGHPLLSPDDIGD